MKKLYFLGPKGTYSEQSALKFLKILNFKCELKPVSTIGKIVNLLDNGSDFGVLPIENLIEGIVRQTIDSLYMSEVKIRGQVDIKIEHCLFSKGNKEDVKNIISHPQALAQCQRYILKNFGEDINLINANSTAAAIQSLVGYDKTYAAIGPNASYDFEINILEKNIGDVEDNMTRFVLVSKENIDLAEKTRTSIVFNTKNEPGALLKILNIIYKHNLNLVYLESRPSKKVFGEYNFFADIDKGENEIQNALNEIKNECNYYKILGSYPVL